LKLFEILLQGCLCCRRCCQTRRIVLRLLHPQLVSHASFSQLAAEVAKLYFALHFQHHLCACMHEEGNRSQCSPQEPQADSMERQLSFEQVCTKHGDSICMIRHQHKPSTLCMLSSWSGAQYVRVAASFRLSHSAAVDAWHAWGGHICLQASPKLAAARSMKAFIPVPRCCREASPAPSTSPVSTPHTAPEARRLWPRQQMHYPLLTWILRKALCKPMTVQSTVYRLLGNA
jgi:hypothetical protein